MGENLQNWKFLRNRSLKYFILPGSCLVMSWTIHIHKKPRVMSRYTQMSLRQWCHASPCQSMIGWDQDRWHCQSQSPSKNAFTFSGALTSMKTHLLFWTFKPVFIKLHTYLCSLPLFFYCTATLNVWNVNIKNHCQITRKKTFHYLSLSLWLASTILIPNLYRLFSSLIG